MDVTYVTYNALPFLSRGWNGRACFRSVLPHAERSKPDVVIGFNAYPEGYAAVEIGRRLGIPAIVGALGSDLRRISDRVTRAMVKRTVQQAAFVITVSEELRSCALRLGGSPRQVRTIPNGCDHQCFRYADRAAARRRLGVNPRTRLIVFTGRLVEVKGLPELIDAVTVLHCTGIPIELAIIGDGPLLRAIQQRCSRYGLEKTVRFLGARSPQEVAGWLAAADVFCLPSYSEGAPNVITEALCCGRPVVATDVGGIPELVDARCGILVPPRDASALADGLRAALERDWNEEFISRFSRRTWTDMAREIFEVCMEALDDRAEPAPAHIAPRTAEASGTRICSR
jgi:glycosyltransferase involved in cell wall biosynthesis